MKGMSRRSWPRHLAALVTAALVGAGFALLAGRHPAGEAPDHRPTSEADGTAASGTANTAAIPFSPLAIPPPPGRRFVPMANETDDWVSPESVQIADYALLKPLAEKGDAIAATKLFLLLSECHELQQRNPLVESEESIRAYQRAGVDVNRMLLDREAKLAACGTLDLSPDDIRGRGRWLGAAAEAGFVHAQLIFASMPEAILGGPSDMLRDPAAVQRYRVDSMRYLAQAAAAGSPSALQILAHSYDNGIITARDRAMAHGLMLAAVQLHPDMARFDWHNRFRDGLSAEELQRARQIAEQYSRTLRGG